MGLMGLVSERGHKALRSEGKGADGSEAVRRQLASQRVNKRTSTTLGSTSTDNRCNGGKRALEEGNSGRSVLMRGIEACRDI